MGQLQMCERLTQPELGKVIFRLLASNFVQWSIDFFHCMMDDFFHCITVKKIVHHYLRGIKLLTDLELQTN